MKYSEAFERDWNWYLKYKDVFNFDGQLNYQFECEVKRDNKGNVLNLPELEKFANRFKDEITLSSRLCELGTHSPIGNITKFAVNKVKPDVDGKDAKFCFYKIDTEGKIVGCKEPELLKQILKCKGSINFNIKQWVIGLEDYCGGYRTVEYFVNMKDLVWNKDGTFTEMSIMEQYELLPWMIKSIENQRDKILKQKLNENNKR